MSKGLEALEKLKEDECYTIKDFNECYTAIEKELKALEIIRRNCDVDNIIAFCVNNEKERDLLKEVLL